MSPLQRSLIAESKNLIDEVVAILEEGGDISPGKVAVKLTKVSGWIGTVLGKDKSEVAENPKAKK